MDPSSRRASCVWLMALLLHSGCGTKEAGQIAREEIGIGTMEGRTWTHDYFGLRVRIPEDWHIFDDAEKAMVTSAGTDLVAGDDQNMRRQLEAAAPRTLTLLGVSRHPLGTPVSFNPNVVIMSERIGGFPGIRSASDYVSLMRQTLEQSQIQVSFEGTESNVRLGPLPADRMASTIQMGLMQIRQRTYVALKGDYVLIATLAYTDDEQLAALEEFCASIEAL